MGWSMDETFDVIGALTRISVGTLDGRDAMMVIELATTSGEFARAFATGCPSP